MKPRPAARYRCEKCGFSWEQPQARAACPTCGHDYVVWVNYREWAATGEPRRT